CASGNCALASSGGVVAKCGVCADAVQRDGACTNDSPPCAVGLLCDRGACIAIGSIEENGACDASDACREGLQCVGGKCAGPLSEGAVCNFTQDCVDGLACARGRCARALADGAACDPNVGGCAATSTCDRYAARCLTPAVVGPGAPCGFINGVEVFCASG